MYLLDTDTYSLYLRGNPRVTLRYDRQDESSIYISDVTVYEILKGRFKGIAEHQKTGGADLVRAYSYLLGILRILEDMLIIHYDLDADKHFASYDAKARRAGTNDCRIAAVAHVHGLIVVTANSKHFDEIGCKHEIGRWDTPNSVLAACNSAAGRLISRQPAQMHKHRIRCVLPVVFILLNILSLC